MELLNSSTAWGCALTIGAYGLGVMIQRKTGKAIMNPLLIGSLTAILVLSLLKIPYADYSAGSYPIRYLLLPATVALAIPLYEKLELLKKNLAAILAGTVAGVLTSLGSIVVLAFVLRLSREQAVTLLPKSVTTAIGMDVAGTLGGMVALASAVIVLTGIMGNLTAEWLCKVCKIEEPLARGIAIGTSSHAIGTSRAIEMGEVEGAMSGLAIAVAGILTAVLAPVAAGLLP